MTTIPIIFPEPELVAARKASDPCAQWQAILKTPCLEHRGHEHDYTRITLGRNLPPELVATRTARIIRENNWPISTIEVEFW